MLLSSFADHFKEVKRSEEQGKMEKIGSFLKKRMELLLEYNKRVLHSYGKRGKDFYWPLSVIIEVFRSLVCDYMLDLRDRQR